MDMDDQKVPEMPAVATNATADEVIEMALRTYIQSQNPFYASAMESYLAPASQYVGQALKLNGYLK